MVRHSPCKSVLRKTRKARRGRSAAAPHHQRASANARGQEGPRTPRRTRAVDRNGATCRCEARKGRSKIQSATGVSPQVIMAYLNDNYLKLKSGYLFPEIARRVNAFCQANAEAAKRLIRCGIGDVTEPLPAAVIKAMHKAIDEMAQRESFRGYGPEQGYEFLRKEIAKNDYRDHGLDVADDEIFVSDGSKCDCGNILDIFGHQNRIGVMDPAYPVYEATTVMAGATGDA